MPVGTCVNLGCVPKKIMYNASAIAETLRYSAADYGFGGTESIHFQWKTLKQARDAHIQKLNDIYQSSLEKEGVRLIRGYAEFIDAKSIRVGSEVIRAHNILVATGSEPYVPMLQGSEYGITSDGFFDIDHCPRRVVIVGSGYIGVELAGILCSLGAETHMMIRRRKVLTNFDSELAWQVNKNIEHFGVTVHNLTKVKCIQKHSVSGMLRIDYEQAVSSDAPKDVDIDIKSTPFTSKSIEDVDCLIWAVGRRPSISKLNLDAVKIRITQTDHIWVDDMHRTCVENIYALGDVIGRADLTPVAIAAGRALSDSLFGGEPLRPFDYSQIPTVIFSHPPAASVGYSESLAIEKYGQNNIKIYRSTFNNIFYAVGSHKVPTMIKLITTVPDERILGLHMVGLGADEILQGFAVALKMGATKKDFDRTIAIHPTAAEEIVTLK